MNLQERKLQIIHHVIQTADKKMIDKIEMVISSTDDFWNDISAEEKNGIEKGLKELDEGKGISLSKVKKKLSKWR
jgi:hypothetical protein